MKLRSGVEMILLGVLATSEMARADLLVLRPGGAASTAILRLRESTAQVASTLKADTEGFHGLALGRDGNVYATANTLGYGEVIRFTRTGRLLGRFTDANLRTPGNLKFGPDGNLYVIGSTWPESPERGVVLRYNGQSGEFMDYFVAPGGGGASVLTDLVFGPNGDLYVADFNNGILRYEGQTGAFKAVLVPAGSAGLDSPTACIFGRDGCLYVCNRESNSVLKFNAETGDLVRVFVPSGRGGLRAPSGLAFGHDGNLYVSSSGNNRIVRFNGRTGQFVDAFVTANPSITRPTRLLFTPLAQSKK